jgi:hypothetical protein
LERINDPNHPEDETSFPMTLITLGKHNLTQVKLDVPPYTRMQLGHASVSNHQTSFQSYTPSRPHWNTFNIEDCLEQQEISSSTQGTTFKPDIENKCLFVLMHKIQLIPTQ